MDFVFGLPHAKGRDGVWRDGIMTVVDHATKQKTLVVVHEGVTAVEAADLFLLWVVRSFGMPQRCSMRSLGQEIPGNFPAPGK